MIKQKKLWDNTLTVIMALLCLLWIYPIVLILLNSLKKEGTFTTSTVFQLPTSETFAGLSNYVYGVIKMGFLSSLGYSLVITVSSERLPAAHSGAGYQEVPHHPHGDPVLPRRLWPCGAGTHDGLHHHRHHPHHHPVHDLPEVHH